MTWEGEHLALRDFVWEGEVPKSQWVPYFEGADLGATYKVLVDKKNLDLIMCDTPLEVMAAQKFIRAARGDVLVVGLGINLVNDRLLDVPDVTSVTTLEIDRDVIENTPVKHEVVEGDATHPILRFKEAFDVVLWDAFCAFNEPLMRRYLKPHGDLVLWDMAYEVDSDLSASRRIKSSKLHKTGV